MVVLRVFQLEVFIRSVRLRWLPSSSCPRRCLPSSLEPIPAVAVVPATVRWSFNSVDRHCPLFATNFPSCRRRRRQLFSILSWFLYPGIIPTSSRWQLVRCAVYTNNPGTPPPPQTVQCLLGSATTVDSSKHRTRWPIDWTFRSRCYHIVHGWNARQTRTCCPAEQLHRDHHPQIRWAQ